MKKQTKKTVFNYDKVLKAKQEEIAKRQEGFVKDLQKIQKKYGMTVDARLILVSDEEKTANRVRAEKEIAEMTKKELTKKKK